MEGGPELADWAERQARIDRLSQARKADSAAKRQAALDAIARLQSRNERVTHAGVAKEAGVSEWLTYNAEEIVQAIEAAVQRQRVRQSTMGVALEKDVRKLESENFKLKEQNQDLLEQLNLLGVDPVTVTPASDKLDTPKNATRPAALRYPGAKWTLAGKIASHFGPHYHYVEPYFGSGAVFFSKDPSPHEVINDLNGQVVNLWRVLRDNTDDLCWALETTPWSRDEYAISDEITGDPLEDARRFVVRVWQAHASDLAKKTGWKNRGVHQRAGGMSHRWQKVPHQLRTLAWRLSDAEIEHRDAISVVKRFNGPDVLIYADPPYLKETRTQKMYSEEVEVEHHVELLAALREHKGPAVLSGYANSMYDEALFDWDRVVMKAPKVEKGASRTEVLWIKRG